MPHIRKLKEVPDLELFNASVAEIARRYEVSRLCVYRERQRRKNRDYFVTVGLRKLKSLGLQDPESLFLPKHK